MALELRWMIGILPLLFGLILLRPARHCAKRRVPAGAIALLMDRGSDFDSFDDGFEQEEDDGWGGEDGESREDEDDFWDDMVGDPEKQKRDLTPIFQKIALGLGASALALLIVLVILSAVKTAPPKRKKTEAKAAVQTESPEETEEPAGLPAVLGGIWDAPPAQEAAATPEPTPVPTPTPTPTPEVKSELEALVLEGESRYYTRAELEKMSKYELSILRNGMYALCGKRFSKNKEVIAFFEACSWYEPRYPKDEDIIPLMNDCEYENVMLIVEIEKERGFR